MGQATVVCIRNPFAPLERGSREIRRVESGGTVLEYVRKFYPAFGEVIHRQAYDITVSIDGSILPEDGRLLAILPEGSSLVFCATPRGGDGKNPLAILAMIAVIVVAPHLGNLAYSSFVTAYGAGVTTPLMAYAASAVYGAVYAGTIIGGALLVNAVFPARLPDTGGLQNLEQSPTYGWGKTANPINEGGPIPWLYGQARVVPPLISKYVESTREDKSYLHLLYGVCEGDIVGMSSPRVNGQAIANYREIDWFHTRGFPDNPPISYFNDTWNEVPVGIQINPGDETVSALPSLPDAGYPEGTVVYLTTDEKFYENVSEAWVEYWVQQQTGTLDQVGVSLTMPKGLFNADPQSGAYSQNTVELYIETSPTGSAPWKRFQVFNYIDLVLTKGRWSAGYLYTGTDDEHWVEVEAGVGMYDWTTQTTTFTASTKKITRSTGSFIDDGFAVGMKIMTNAVETENQGPLTIAAGGVSGDGLELTVEEDITDEGPSNLIVYEFHHGEKYIFTDYNYDEGTPYTRVGKWKWLDAGTYKKKGTLLNDYVALQEAKASPLRRTFRSEVLSQGTYYVRMRYKQPPTVSDFAASEVWWDNYAEILTDDLSYPGIALMSMLGLANDQLSEMPTVDVIADRGTSIPYRDGPGNDYSLKPSSNPAWACYDILHQARRRGYTLQYFLRLPSMYDVYGVPWDEIDYDAFAAWAAFCDDTAGGKNAYTCNMYFDGPMNRRKALDVISQLGRGVVFQMGSKWTCVWDSPVDLPTQKFLFNVGNIVKDSFKTEYVPMEDRANVIEVTYFPADKDYERTTIQVYQEGFDEASDDIKQSAVTLYGCTNTEMAIRHATFLLRCNRYLSVMVSFEADVDAIACLPGEVIEVQHDVPQFGVGGRVESATSNTITLDRPVEIEAAKTYYVTVKHQDDDTREEKLVTTGVGTWTTLSISGTWTKTPVQHALYSFGEENSVVRKFRVSRITRTSELRRKIIALEHVSEVYSDTATVPDPPDPPAIKVPSNLMVREIWIGGTTSTARLSWGNNAPEWYVFFRSGIRAYELAGRTSGNFFDIPNLPYGVTYTFCVSSTAFPWDGVEVGLALSGPGTLPLVENPTFIDSRCFYTDKLQLSWNASDISYLWYFELRTDLDWGSGEITGQGLEMDAGGFVTPDGPASLLTGVPAGGFVYRGTGTSVTYKPGQPSYTFFIRARDIYGRWSTTYDQITLTHVVPVPVFVGITSSSYGSLRIEWETINDESFDVVEIWRCAAGVNDRNLSFKVGEIHSNVYVDSGLTIETTYYYWLKTRSVFNTYSSWSTDRFNGHEGTTSGINVDDLAQVLRDQLTISPDVIPPKIISSLDAAPLPSEDYPQGTIVFNLSDKKLYWNPDGDEWVLRANTEDIYADFVQAGILSFAIGGGYELAAQIIAVKNLLVGGWGAALNLDPHLEDVSEWKGLIAPASLEFPPDSGKYELWRIGDGWTGPNVLSPQWPALGRGTVADTQRFFYNNSYIKVDREKSYRVSLRARKSDITADGTFAFGLFEYRQATGGGYEQIPGADITQIGNVATPEDRPLSQEFQRYYVSVGPHENSNGQFNYQTIAVRLCVVLGNGATTGYIEAQDIRIEEMTPGTLVVDGSISAKHVGTNELIASDANIGEAVIKTLHIGENQVTIPSYNQSSSAVYITSTDAGNPTEIISVVHQASGQPVWLIFSLECAGPDSGEFLGFHFYKQKTGYSELLEYFTSAYSIGTGLVHQVNVAHVITGLSAGEWTFKVKAHKSGGSNPYTGWHTVMGLEMKR